MNRFAVTVCASLLPLVVASARAETPRATQKDADLGQKIAEGHGIILIETTVIQTTNAGCGQVDVMFVRLNDKQKFYLMTVMAMYFNIGATLGGVRELPPGDYVLAATTCLQHGVGKHTVVGPHARFQVRSGEIVNIGMFKMTQQHEHPVNLLNPFDKNPVISRRSIEPLSAQAIAYFKETIPYTFAKAVMRPMTLLGSPQSELKKPRTIFD